MRGVNKLVVEVKPDSEYFEKAVLFLKTDKYGLPQKDISSGAEKLISGISEGRSREKRRINPDPVPVLLAGVAAGSAVSWIIAFIISLAG